MKYLADDNDMKYILKGPHATQNKIDEYIKNTLDKQSDSFQATYLMIKGEILDIKGMIDALTGRENVIKTSHKLEESKQSKQKEVDSMTMGKSTMKSFFKSKSTIEKDINKYQLQIDQMNSEMEDYTNLITFLTAYHGQLAIDKFKKLKVAAYFKMLNMFSVREIGNAQSLAQLYHGILNLNEQ